ncbi:class I SAM-dependent methyltransferase [Ruegeria sp. 2205SS24-7]|uniref:class I SAM-dependent methyltransferase n=1 Tax=Ruegeria discodermiae TaxID=3064389 RepID=UPI00274031E6|nr:class I SAM-dependent methyltransferase [Ruegeria sp. 2205SS24-7]MDP5216485.1 class I SAM-dependent methyltransferase [Ruegeria sp. 2205SS24-7]
MRQARKMLSANFAEEHADKIPTLLSVSEQAQKFLAEVGGAGKKMRVVIEVDDQGVLSSTLEADPELLELSQAMKLQFRGELIADGYNIRKVDFSKIHGVAGNDLGKLADAMEIPDGARVLDLMCGYGAVSAHILNRAANEGHSIELSMCDLHKVQLDRIPDEVREAAADVTVGDARNLPYEDASFDAVVIKMGLHEVPHIDQPLVFQQVFRVLKPGGRFVIWEVMPDTGEQQDAFTEQMQKKNELAGYESIVVDRYFTRGEQMPWLYEEAGFAGVKQVFEANFHQSTLGRLDSELGGDHHKLDDLNAFVRRCTPDAIRTEVDYKDEGDSISMKVPNRIFRAIKPE